MGKLRRSHSYQNRTAFWQLEKAGALQKPQFASNMLSELPKLQGSWQSTASAASLSSSPAGCLRVHTARACKPHNHTVMSYSPREEAKGFVLIACTGLRKPNLPSSSSTRILCVKLAHMLLCQVLTMAKSVAKQGMNLDHDESLTSQAAACFEFGTHAATRHCSLCCCCCCC